MNSFLARSIVISILLIAIVVTLFPFTWMLVSSLKPREEIFSSTPRWFAESPTLTHYRRLFTQFNFKQLTVNSVLISVGVTFIGVLFGGLSAYGFSRFPFPGSHWLLVFILITRMITPAALVVPFYRMMKFLGLLNTVFGIMVGVAVVNLPFAVWIIKPFFDNMPREIEEAAALDGLSDFGIFFKIVVPMAKPAIVTVALFSFIAGWVDLLFGITLSTTPQAMPLTVGISRMQTGKEVFWGPMMAGGVYLALPTLLLGLAFQKYLTKGFMVE